MKWLVGKIEEKSPEGVPVEKPWRVEQEPLEKLDLYDLRKMYRTD